MPFPAPQQHTARPADGGSPQPCHAPAHSSRSASELYLRAPCPLEMTPSYCFTETHCCQIFQIPTQPCFQQHFSPNIFSCGTLRKTGKLLCLGRTAQCCFCSRAASFPRRPPAHHHYNSLPALPRCPQFLMVAEMSSGKLA